ncbi:MAG: hypothetical protein R3A79_25695 [Nannocystaceae bacterium]
MRLRELGLLHLIAATSLPGCGGAASPEVLAQLKADCVTAELQYDVAVPEAPPGSAVAGGADLHDTSTRVEILVRAEGVRVVGAGEQAALPFVWQPLFVALGSQHEALTSQAQQRGEQAAIVPWIYASADTPLADLGLVLLVAQTVSDSGELVLVTAKPAQTRAVGFPDPDLARELHALDSRARSKRTVELVEPSMRRCAELADTFIALATVAPRDRCPALADGIERAAKACPRSVDWRTVSTAVMVESRPLAHSRALVTHPVEIDWAAADDHAATATWGEVAHAWLGDARARKPALPVASDRRTLDSFAPALLEAHVTGASAATRSPAGPLCGLGWGAACVHAEADLPGFDEAALHARGCDLGAPEACLRVIGPIVYVKRSPTAEDRAVVARVADAMEKRCLEGQVAACRPFFEATLAAARLGGDRESVDRELARLESVATTRCAADDPLGCETLVKLHEDVRRDPKKASAAWSRLCEVDADRCATLRALK